MTGATQALTGDQAMQRVSAALKAAAPGADQSVWLDPISVALMRADATTPNRMCAFLGQAVGECGPALTETAEDLYYVTAQRAADIFKTAFHGDASLAAPYMRNPEKLANRVYANRQGNGDEASGDGWRYRGGGLFQLTGRAEYEPYAKDRNMTVEAAAAYVRTPAGAADSAAWYWAKNGCGVLADAWRLSAITRLINGAAMLGNDVRISAANAALRACMPPPIIR